MGTRLLSEGMLNYRVANRFESYFQNSEGLSAEKKGAFLTGGVNATSLRETDVTQWTSIGPVTMEPGTSVDDFLTNTDQAHNLRQQVSVSREEERVRPAEHGGAWALSAPYPNPTVFPVHLRFESASPGGVTLTVYDLLGRRIRDRVDSPHAEGEHVAAWDGLDDTGMRVASGLYMVWMTAHTDNQTIVKTQPVMVVR